CRALEPLRITRSVRHEAPTPNKVASAEDRWQSRAKCKGKDAHQIGDHQLINRNVKCVCLGFHYLERRTEILHPPNFDWHDFNTERESCSLGLPHLQYRLGIPHIEDDG